MDSYHLPIRLNDKSPTTNKDVITPNATGPIGSHSSAAVDFNGDYSSDALEKFWSDWVGWNYTHGTLGAYQIGIFAEPIYDTPVIDQGPGFDSSDAGWAVGAFGNGPTTYWLQNTRQFLRTLLAQLVERYPTEGDIHLSEFGFSEPFENEENFLYQITEDVARTAYFNSYLGEVLKGVVEDGVPIKGVFAWSMLDNFEWNSGLGTRFGVRHVNYNSPTLERTCKRSAMELSGFWNTHRLSDDDDEQQW